MNRKKYYIRYNQVDFRFDIESPKPPLWVVTSLIEMTTTRHYIEKIRLYPQF